MNGELFDFEMISFLLKTQFSFSLNRTKSAFLPSFKRSLSSPIIFLGETVNNLITSNNFKKPYDAIHAYEKALEINPNHVETLNNLGTIHHYILQYEKSIEYI